MSGVDKIIGCDKVIKDKTGEKMRNKVIPMEVYEALLEKRALVPSGMMGYYRAKLDKKNPGVGALKGMGGGVAGTAAGVLGAGALASSGLKGLASTWGKSVGERLEKFIPAAESAFDDLGEKTLDTLSADDVKTLGKKLKTIWGKTPGGKIKGKKRLIAAGLLGGATMLGVPSLLGAHLTTKKWGKK